MLFRSGKFRPLHVFNPVRLKFIRDLAAEHFGRPSSSLKPFQGLTLLDIGCGGGLLSEPMARLGFSVLGVKVDEDSSVAFTHKYMAPEQYTDPGQVDQRADLGRRPSETEGEYLGRALGALGAQGAALHRLTELFAVARFSDDPVDEAMRSEALAALEQIRAQVGAVGSGTTGPAGSATR